MKIGICFGGYCPLHQGHLDVIMKAKKENDKCLVIVCGYDNEPRGWEINLNLEERYELIKDFFADDEQIIVDRINDTMLGIDESMSANNWNIWTKAVGHLLAVYGLVSNEYDVSFYVAEPFYKDCIEKYCEWPIPFNVVLIPKLNQVSGTQARKNPIKYWNKITAPFKQYLCKNILVIGTASEGKSTVVKDISRYFDIPYAEEFGRRYLAEHNMTDVDLKYMDFKIFLRGQNLSCIKNIRESKNGIFISDTDNTVTLMYAAAYVDDPNINISQKDYDNLYEDAKRFNEKYKVKWDHIFIFPPSKTFVDDGTRYMKQASMEERNKNFDKLIKLVNDFYPEVSKTYLNGSFLENFNNVKDYINSLIEI